MISNRLLNLTATSCEIVTKQLGKSLVDAAFYLGFENKQEGAKLFGGRPDSSEDARCRGINDQR